MIVDAHCHAWERWPYQPEPADLRRGAVENLLIEMDQSGVERAVIICAAIGGNPDSNLYACEAAARSNGRLVAFVDADSRWLPTHRSEGAAERLERLVERFRPRGITHYMHEEGDASWLHSIDGAAFLRVAEAHGLVLSLACGPGQMAAVIAAASMVPRVTILLHHLARIRAGEEVALGMVLKAAAVPNISVKLSGFGYGTAEAWDFPLVAMRPIVEALHGAFGAHRLVWGSDWPVSTRFMTHRQSLEILRRHCGFIPEAEMELILGRNMERLLAGETR